MKINYKNKICNNHLYLGNKIKNNYFSLDKIVIDIDDKITIKGIINYSNLTKINKNIYSPNIIVSFSYLTNIECNHSIISLRHKLNGQININDNTINFDNETGYIEKGYGNSFSKKYI